MGGRGDFDFGDCGSGGLIKGGRGNEGGGFFGTGKFF